MHDDAAAVEARLRRLLSERLRPAVYSASIPCELGIWEVPGEPVPPERALVAPYGPAAPGRAWGPPWRTAWLRIAGEVPPSWAGRQVELVVDLGFGGAEPGFQAEGLAFDGRGVPLKGISPRSMEVPLSLLDARAGERFVCYVEAAANPPIMGGGRGYAPTRLGDPATAGDAPLYRLGDVRLSLLDEEVWRLCLDVEVALGLAAELDPHRARRHELLRALEAAADRIDLDDVGASAASGRAALSDALSSPAAASAHRVLATGHAHIDSAWLWPVRETVRKCARTFASVAALAEQYPELVFSCSQAQHYAWVEERYPDLFARVRRLVATGRWVPVGGTWVEPDGNLCGGEALVRQLVLGRRYFAERLGVECKEVWLPDSFGYSAAWPQLARLAGASYFVTQKLSWNDTNTFPHSTFLWEGIDGSRILTHFPPVSTYNSQLTPDELARAERNFAEQGRSSRSLVPFGYGDGGGGPTREMLERARRQRDLDGSPRVEIGPPERFFRDVEAEYADPPVWSGELYLELHRGTFTSQARLKRANRRCEGLLREAELWSTAAFVAGRADYPYEELDRAWKQLLLLQFHDILPGSSIAWVNDEALESYAGLEAELEAIAARATKALAGPGDVPVAFNCGPREVDGVPALGAAVQRPPCEPPGASGVSACAEQVEGRQGIVLDNGLLRVVVDGDGLVRSVYDLAAGREVLAPGARANLLQLHRDLPSRWDAWDVDASYRRSAVDLSSCESVRLVPAAGGESVVEVRRHFGRAGGSSGGPDGGAEGRAGGGSSALQRIRLAPGERRVRFETEVDWHEEEKLLKVAFPLDLRAEWSSAEIQFGHVSRPVHVNTSWEAARFECFAHRWLHVGEAGYGVALANDSTYGHDVSRTTRSDGGTTTTLRLSLVRGPRFPDPRADAGAHRFGYVLAPGATVAEAVAEGYRLNLPLRLVSGGAAVAPVLTVDDEGRGAVVVESVKAADDGSGDVVVRCYEALGGRACATLAAGFDHVGAVRCDLLEHPLAGEEPQAEGAGPPPVRLELRAFEVVTLRFCRSRRHRER